MLDLRLPPAPRLAAALLALVFAVFAGGPSSDGGTGTGRLSLVAEAPPIMKNPGDVEGEARLVEHGWAQAGRGESADDNLGGNSLEELYIVALPECLYAGRAAYRELQVKLVRHQSNSTWAAVDGRLEDATPVRIKGEVVSETRTRVVFTVGTQPNEEHRAFTRRLKTVFEEKLRLTR
jgi:hypothetical protein